MSRRDRIRAVVELRPASSALEDLRRGALAAIAAALLFISAVPAIAQQPSPKVQMRIVVACDDFAQVYLNGALAGEVTLWSRPTAITLTAGEFPLLVAVQASNADGPAALVGALLAKRPAASATLEVPAEWRCSATREQGWELPSFDDSDWSAATAIVPYGQGLWGDQPGLGLTRSSWTWLAPPAEPRETVYCRWRITLPPIAP
jgi:hypothetical protein